MSAPDYSQRDKAVRHNIYASVRRRHGLPHELFAAYWRDVHSTLCSRLPGLGFYVQQHFDRNHTANLWPIADGVRPIRAVIDGSAELGFANLDDQATFAEAGTILYGDEANFIGEAVAYALPNGSQTYVDREEDGTRNGPDRYHRIHVYMNRKPGNDPSVWLAETSAELAHSEAVRKWKLHLPEPYSNDRPAPPSPNVDHLVEGERLNLAVAEVAFASARTAREFFATPAFRKVLAKQATYVDALGAYLVTGFYTFVRDGRLTTAGLRGSRSAELIEAAGAANQLEPPVVSKFMHSTAE
ncbi:MAG TPA: EthD domain-containing protein [Candidatus Acidoferrum sp.]|nr:EthD domain-containing protein [Candidatus Acidoferrum sp.]